MPKAEGSHAKGRGLGRTYRAMPKAEGDLSLSHAKGRGLRHAKGRGHWPWHMGGTTTSSKRPDDCAMARHVKDRGRPTTGKRRAGQAARFPPPPGERALSKTGGYSRTHLLRPGKDHHWWLPRATREANLHVGRTCYVVVS